MAGILVDMWKAPKAGFGEVYHLSSRLLGLGSVDFPAVSGCGLSPCRIYILAYFEGHRMLILVLIN